MPRGEQPRSLLIATAGGHLTQLTTLAERLDIDIDRALWVTVSTQQSRSLLAGRDVVWAKYSSPRDMRSLTGHARLAWQTARQGSFDLAVSTGASLAPPFLAMARTQRIPCHYIESATRVDGPSFSGRLVARIPGVHLYSQYESWARGAWSYGGSIFDGWTTAARPQPRPLRRALVTVGSARGFPFTRMLEAARRVLPADCAVTWQVGGARVSGLDGRVVDELDSGDLSDVLKTADVVISHAGTGSALTALEHGLCPVLVPRQAAHDEHVDDHQLEIARMLEARDLAIVGSADHLDIEHLHAAAARTAQRVDAPRFRLAR